MAKFFGVIGFGETSDKNNIGVWGETIVEREYYGDLTRNLRRLEASEALNDNINISNEISIIADPYAVENFHKMRYVEFMGAKWKISSAEVHFPRLILTIGGLYNVHSQT